MSGKRSATGNSTPRLRVLYDGWPLAYAPGSPAALHLLELLSALPDAVEAWVALPAQPDKSAAIDGGVSQVLETVPDTSAGRLRWEQRVLGRAARQQRARLIHTTTLYPPLIAPCPVIVSPAENKEEDSLSGGAAVRARTALGRGGLRSVRAVLWPQDIPPTDFYGPPVWKLPVTVHAAFSTDGPLPEGLPENYVLVPGPLHVDEMDLLTAAWSWASGGLGQGWTLLADGLDEPAQALLRERFEAAGFGESLAFLPRGSLQDRATAYRQAGCVLLLRESEPWASASLQALASGCAIAAQENALEDARIGPAGYLTPTGDARALGAAVLSIIVEEELADTLREAARRRTAQWNRAAFGEAIARAYAAAVPDAAQLLLPAREQDIHA